VQEMLTKMVVDGFRRKMSIGVVFVFGSGVMLDVLVFVDDGGEVDEGFLENKSRSHPAPIDNRDEVVAEPPHEKPVFGHRGFLLLLVFSRHPSVTPVVKSDCQLDNVAGIHKTPEPL